jgi:hypothetical protein
MGEGEGDVREATLSRKGCLGWGGLVFLFQGAFEGTQPTT